MEAALCIFEQSPSLIMKCYAGKTEVGNARDKKKRGAETAEDRRKRTAKKME